MQVMSVKCRFCNNEALYKRFHNREAFYECNSHKDIYYEFQVSLLHKTLTNEWVHFFLKDSKYSLNIKHRLNQIWFTNENGFNKINLFDTIIAINDLNKLKEKLNSILILV